MKVKVEIKTKVKVMGDDDFRPRTEIKLSVKIMVKAKFSQDLERNNVIIKVRSSSKQRSRSI